VIARRKFRNRWHRHDARRRFSAGGKCAAAILVAFSVLTHAGISPAQEMRFFRIGTGSTAGTYYPVGALIASAISNPPGSRACEAGGSCGVPGLIASAMTTRGSIANIEAISSGDLESGLAQSDLVQSAVSGLGVFAARGYRPKIRVIANLYPESLHLVVRKAAGITSVAGLKGHRISLDAIGSGTRVNARIVLSVYGVRESDIDDAAVTADIAIELLLQNQIDAFFLVAGYPAPAVTELAEKGKATLLPIEGEAARELTNRYRFFSHDRIPAGIYSNIGEMSTISVGAQWIVNADLNENLVYEITKSLWHPRNRQLLWSGHAKGKLLRPDTALTGVATPLHAGAERYYREAGLLK